MKKALVSLGIIIILGVGVFFVTTSPRFGKTKVDPLLIQGEGNKNLSVSATIKTEGGAEIDVRIADTDKTRTLGLSYMKSLPNDQGMLFLFDKSAIYPFWMKGMNFPIDIVWLKKVKEGEFVVVYTASNVLPESYPQNISPGEAADAVLEVNSGVATVYNLIPEKKLWISFKK